MADALIWLAFTLFVTVMTGWVASDALARGRRWVAWFVATSFFGLFSVIAWLVMRRRATLVSRPAFRIRALIYNPAMKQLALRIVLVSALVGLGWVAGQTQATQADFELEVSSPNGSTTITCRRGCGLQFIRASPNKVQAQPSFTYECNSHSGRCGGVVQGWVVR